MSTIDEVAQNIYLIDDQLYSIPKFGGVYLIDEEKKALIDSGPSVSASIVLEGIKRIGVDPKDIAYIIVTHVHLDHAGGAGVLLKDMPQAQVVVHHRGARHLVDPSRLVASVAEVRGEKFAEEVGEVLPITAHRVQAVSDGDTIKLSDQQILEFLDTPGHTPHELCIYESRNRGVFIGDAAGVYIPESEVLLPLHPPPGFDLELSISTIKRLMQLKPARIYFAHFGVSNKAEQTLQLALDKIQAWADVAAKAVAENTREGAVEKMIAELSAELEPLRERKSLYEYLTKTSLPMFTEGFLKYYQERQLKG